MSFDKIKQIATKPRVIILVLFLLMSFIAISPSFSTMGGGPEGVAIKNVLVNSSAEKAGIIVPEDASQPTDYEVILTLNDEPIQNLAHFYKLLDTIKDGDIVKLGIQSHDSFLGLSKSKTTSYILDVPLSFSEYSFGEARAKALGLRVSSRAKNNLNMGLDLAGGTRILLSPEEDIDQNMIDLIKSNMERRLNVYGLSDIAIRTATDLPKVLGGSGKSFIIVEIAGATEEEVRTLISSQGKFEAKIANKTVFFGGQNDITYVCRSSDCAGLNPHNPCGKISDDEWGCGFAFSISLKVDAAERFKEIVNTLDVISVGEDGRTIPRDQQFLSSPIEFYLDDVLTNSLNIGASLQGNVQTEVQIQGSGRGTTYESAQADALQKMKQMQTVLVTGSLPVKLNIERTDVVSPILGQEFLDNAILVGIFALFAVVAVVFIRYKRLSIVIPLIISILSELVIVLGIAALIHWNLDLAAIAGIIIAVGTGVDDLIIITDTTVNGGKKDTSALDWKKRFKSALAIVMAAYFTTVVAMVPLMVAGAGLLKGFAVTTLIGISVGVFITRPTFATLIGILYKD